MSDRQRSDVSADSVVPRWCSHGRESRMLYRVVRKPHGHFENCINKVRSPHLLNGQKHSLPTGENRFVSLFSTAPMGDLDCRFWRLYWRKLRHSFNYTVQRRLRTRSLTRLCSVRMLPTQMVTLKEVRWDLCYACPRTLVPLTLVIPLRPGCRFYF